MTVLLLLLRLFTAEPTCTVVAIGEEYVCTTSPAINAGVNAGLDPQED